MNRAESRDEKPKVDSFDGIQENSPRGADPSEPQNTGDEFAEVRLSLDANGRSWNPDTRSRGRKARKIVGARWWDKMNELDRVGYSIISWTTIVL